MVGLFIQYVQKKTKKINLVTYSQFYVSSVLSTGADLSLGMLF